MTDVNKACSSMTDEQLHTVTMAALYELFEREGFGGILEKFAYIIALVCLDNDINVDRITQDLKAMIEAGKQHLASDPDHENFGQLKN